MKLRIMGLALLLVSTSFLIIGCPSSNSPSSPAPPAPTNTVCQNASGTPCTSTFTSTPSNTATTTPSGTPSNTTTATNTRTLTGTPTFTGTSTPTATITDTLTVTPTATITQTPTVTATFTITSTPTNTVPVPPTSTPTDTPTSTNTACTVPAATNTPNLGYSITGTLTDSTSGTYNSANPIAIIFVPVGASGNGQPAIAFLNSSTGTYGPLGVGSSGTYMPVFWHNVLGTGHTPNIQVGDYAGINGTTSCVLSNGTAVNINSNLTGQNYTFSETNQLYGFAGTITYTGGTVDYCHQLHVNLYTPNSVTAGNSSTAPGSGANYVGNANQGGISSNGVRYDAIPYNSSSSLCATQNVDLLAYYDLNGSYSIATGDPYVLMSNVGTSLATTNNISITNSTTW